jgi:uncharacterized membrane protein
VVLFSKLVQSINNLQITNVLDMIGSRGRETIRDLFQRLDEAETPGDGAAKQPDRRDLGAVTQTLRYSGEPRALASIDTNSLVRLAAKAGGVIVMAYAVGDTLAGDTVVLRVHGGKENLPDSQLMRAIRLAIVRTFEQDPKYPIRLLVDIAIKALSPAINDPTTAVQAIDQIEDLLHRLGRRDLDAGYGRDANGKLRLVYPMPTWEDYLTLAFDEIRQYGTGSVQVMRRLRSALVGILESVTHPDRLAVVRRYIEHLDVAIEQSPLDARDKDMARHEDRQGLGLTRGT